MHQHPAPRFVPVPRARARGRLRIAVVGVVVVLALVLPATAGALTVSGNAYADEQATPAVWAGCDGATANVSLSFDGGAKASVPCNASTGAFAFTTTFAAANRVAAVFLDPASPGSKGVSYFRNVDTTSNVAGLRPTLGRVRIEPGSATALGNSALDTFDSTQDPDIPASVVGTTLTVDPGHELHVAAGASYMARGNVDTGSLHLAGRYVGATDERLTLRSSGTGACTAGAGTMRPLCIDGGTFVPRANHLTRFVGTASTYVEATSYGRLALAPGGAGSPTYALGSAASQALRTGRLAVGDGTNPVTVTTGTFAPIVTIDGPLSVAANGTYGGSGSGTTTVTGEVSGAGTISLAGGLFDHRLASLRTLFGTTTSALQWTFANLRFSDSSVATWATSGQATYNYSGTSNDRVDDMVRADDGSLYIAGFRTATSRDWVVRRYTPTGALDTGWASSGTYVHDAGGSSVDILATVEVDAAGNLYLGGNLDDAATNPIGMIRRLTPSGALDTSWGSGGVVTYDAGPNLHESFQALDFDGQGRLYAAGRQFTNGEDMFVRRYLPNGTLDPTWASSGTLVYNSGGSTEDKMTSMVVTSTGKVIMAGYSSGSGYDWVIRRYNPDGSLDTSWNGTGHVQYNSSGAVNDIISLHGLALDDDGNLFASGYIGSNSTDIAVRKYDANGALVTSWGSSGMVTHNSGAGQDAGYQIALDSSGRLLVTGYQQTNGYDWVILRYTPTGALDTTFGSGSGMINYNTGATTTDAPRAIVVEPDGSFIVGGYHAVNGSDWAIRKYDAGGNFVDGTAGSAPTATAAAGGTGGIALTGSLTVGDAGDRATTTLDLDANDRTVDVDGNVTVTTRGSLKASSSAGMTVGGDFTNDGTFTHSGGTVTFDDAALTSNLRYAAPLTFGSIVVTTPNKEVRLDATDRTTVAGTFTANGGACGTRVRIRSVTTGTAAQLDVTGTPAIEFVDVADSSAITALVAGRGSVNSGNTTGWTFRSCPPAAPTSPTQIAADGSTIVATGARTTDGGTTTIRLRATVSDPDAGSTITPWVEVRPTSVAFSASCGSSVAGVTFSGPSVSMPTAGVGYQVEVPVTGLTDGGYHWRLCAVDQTSAEGAWTAHGAATDFIVYIPDPPGTPALVAPADNAWTTSRVPLLSAGFTDPDPTDTGTLEFDLCANEPADPWATTCGASYRGGESPGGIANPGTGSWAPNAELGDGTWYWRARSRDETGRLGPWRAPAWRVRVDATAPTRPPNVRVTLNGNGSMAIAWDASTDATSGIAAYDVETSTDGVTWTVQCDDTTSLTCSKGGLGSTQRVFFRVRAYDVAGNPSAWSYLDGTSPTSYYLRTSVASALLPATTMRQATLPPVATGNTTSTIAHEKNLGWYVFAPGTSVSTPTGGQPSSAPVAAAGSGWILDATAGRTLPASDITATLALTSPSGQVTSALHCRFWRVRTSGGLITSNVHLGTSSPAGDMTTGALLTQTCSLPSAIGAQVTLAADEAIYLEVWLEVTASAGGPGGQLTSLVVEDASSFVEMQKAGVPPGVPSLVAPADGAITGTAPSLTATYTHPGGIGGTVAFEVATDSSFTSIVDAGTSPVVGSGANASYQPQALDSATTYYWRARATDNEARMASAWSSTWSFRTSTAPTAPTNLAPADGATGGLSPNLTSSAFADPDSGATHAASHWRVRTSAGSYADAVADSGTTATNLTSWTVPATLTAGVTYRWQVRHRDAQGMWSAWSTETSFVADSASLSVSVDDTSVAIPMLVAGVDEVASTQVTVVASNGTGYVLSATDTSDTDGLSCVCGDAMRDWSGAAAAPTTWASGTSGLEGYFGITVRDATGGRLAKWGAGTATAETDFTDNAFAGLTTSAAVLHSRATATAGDTIVVTYRANVPADTTAGTYDSTVAYTAVANP